MAMFLVKTVDSNIEINNNEKRKRNKIPDMLSLFTHVAVVVVIINEQKKWNDPYLKNVIHFVRMCTGRHVIIIYLHWSSWLLDNHTWLFDSILFMICSNRCLHNHRHSHFPESNNCKNAKTFRENVRGDTTVPHQCSFDDFWCVSVSLSSPSTPHIK